MDVSNGNAGCHPGRPDKFARGKPPAPANQCRARARPSAGAHVLFLPPYSPDLNPIEQASAKIKHQLRNAAARSRGTLWRAVGEVREDIEPRCCVQHMNRRNVRNTSEMPDMAPTRADTL